MTLPPRLLVLMGSGETTGSMAPVHRTVVTQLGATGRPVVGAILDTPYGFQDNAPDISAAALDFFERRVGMRAEVATLRGADGDDRERAASMELLRRADLVFSGPGSPSYALRHWARTDVPRLLADKLAHGGAIVMASAAALTLGRLTPPVYEIYKVGEEPRWIDGLDLLTAHGLPVVVIPHWDNAEGRGHDTRYCFLGERRLLALEADLPDDVFLLGIDEHTALVVDLDAGRATIRGRGTVTVRRRGHTVTFSADERPSLADLRAAAFGTDRDGGTPFGTRPPADTDATDPVTLLATGVIAGAADPDGADPTLAPLVDPLVDALVEARSLARDAGEYAIADRIRDRLRAIGVTLQDTPDGTSWSLPETSGASRIDAEAPDAPAHLRRAAYAAPGPGFGRKRK